MFNHYVRVALAEKEWSQATLARKMKKPKSWLNDRMGGRTEFREPEMAAIVRCGSYSRIMPSKQYERYEKDAGHFLRRIAPTEPIDEPVEVTAVFYMPTRRRVDLTNLLEALDDVLVKYGILEDDNCRIIASHDGSRVEYDKDNPRTEITIKKMPGH